MDRECSLDGGCVYKGSDKCNGCKYKKEIEDGDTT